MATERQLQIDETIVKAHSIFNVCCWVCHGFEEGVLSRDETLATLRSLLEDLNDQLDLSKIVVSERHE